MVEKLRPGTLHGRTVKSLRVSDFILTETAYDAHAKLPRHAHENSYFCFVLQGVYTERYGGREVTCQPSSVSFRVSEQPHEALLHDTDTRVFVLEIPPPWIEKLRTSALRLENRSGFYGGRLPQLCARVNSEFHKSDSAASLAIEGLTLEILAEASRQAGSGVGTSPAWLRQVQEMLLEQFAKPPGLTRIAAEVGVHPVYLATAFRKKFGMTVGEFVRQLRIEHACAALLKGESPLAEIALQAGFVDQSHFSKVFKSYIGTTPAKYRRSVRRCGNET